VIRIKGNKTVESLAIDVMLGTYKLDTFPAGLRSVIEGEVDRLTVEAADRAKAKKDKEAA
jgi:hypothetical protein